MELLRFTGTLLLGAALAWPAQVAAGENPVPPSPERPGYAGSPSCRECHEKFYTLWSTSMHGLAMQPYTPDFAKARLTRHQGDVVVGDLKYRADPDKGVVIETGPEGKKTYPMEQVLGGKNVCYFLTLLPKGRLQTLPLAYDLDKKEWFDTAASGIRHYPGGETGQAIGWREWPYTFNTACYSCHVSRLSTNYDPKTDEYRTIWSEPGINCEACHGPADEHNKIARATPKGKPLTELRIIRTKTMTREQRNDLCSGCHAKASPLTLEYKPGERFFDHFDLVTLEDPDYYPDGRDIGENYTLTSWRMSPCAGSGRIDCMHCHTSSGRYRFKNEKWNDACVPCHADKVGSPAEHTHHPAESVGSRCISCHMPMTSFARMNRSDHSMRPPAPAATVEYKSPNACNLCHTDKDAVWADRLVRKWRTRDYQAPLLQRASFVDAARKRDWSRLPEMLEYVRSKDRDEVFAASLLRLMMANPDGRITPVLLSAMKDPSPLVRSSAVEAISARPTREGTQALLDAAGDGFRLVRIRAAAGLTGYPMDRLPEEVRSRVEKADREFLAFLMARPDQWTSHYNMGNYRLGGGKLKEAVSSYQAALRIEPRAVLAMVNSSIAYSRMGDNDNAGKSLRAALEAAPENPEANFNMGLLEAERSDPKEAERYLKAALKYDPRMAEAAYNLCILLSKDRLEDAVPYCRKASGLRPDDPAYAYTLAFFLHRKGETAEAVRTLKAITEKHPGYEDAESLLGDITTGSGSSRSSSE
ncbi:MAG: tetratricopeptide repeat protein [bacterium]